MTNHNPNKVTAYHGTERRFKRFSSAEIGSATDDGIYGRGFYFTNDFQHARSYGRRVIQANLLFSNPFIVHKGDSVSKSMRDAGLLDGRDDLVESIGGGLTVTSSQATEILKQYGYDGVIKLDFYDRVEYVAFESTQIEIIEKAKLKNKNRDPEDSPSP